MAKQTKAQKETAQVQEAEIVNVETVEVVQASIVPAVTGKNVVMFTPDTKDRLIAAFVNAEVINFEKSADECKKLARKYSKLKVADKDDKTGYDAVKTAYNELVKIRTSTDKERKRIGEPYAEIKKGIDAHAKNNVVDVLASTEATLKIEKDKFEKWEQDEQDRREQEEQTRLDERIVELKEAGIVFDGDLYSINEISVDLGTIKKFSDFDYNALLAKVKIEKQANDDAAAAAKQAQDEQDAKDQKAREDNERERKENRAEKLEMRTEKLEILGFVVDDENERYTFEKNNNYNNLSFDDVAAMNKTTFDETIAKHKLLLEKIKEDEIVAKTAQLIKSRWEILQALDITDEDGARFWYNGKMLEGIADDDLGNDDANEWATRLEDVKTQIAAIKAEKEAQDKKAKEEQDKKEKEENEKRMPDLLKVERYADEVMGVAMPELKNEDAVRLLIELKTKIKTAVDETLTEIRNF